MKYQVKKDKHKRNLVKSYELKRKMYRSALKNQKLNPFHRSLIQYMLDELPRNSSPIRVKNRCIVSGRAKAVHKKYKVSRLTFRKLMGRGVFGDVIKKQW